MIVQPPKTLNDYFDIKKSILDLMANPYCDQFMFLRLIDKRNNVQSKIDEIVKSLKVIYV